MGGCNITTGTLTINNVRITTCNSTTLNATNVICTGGDVDLGNGDQLIMPNGNSAGRAGGGSPSFGSMYVNTELDIIEMYTNKQGTLEAGINNYINNQGAISRIDYYVTIKVTSIKR